MNLAPFFYLSLVQPEFTPMKPAFTLNAGFVNAKAKGESSDEREMNISYPASIGRNFRLG
jgi:hypothetical protein